jgi:tripartite motif-containing protein 71
MVKLLSILLFANILFPKVWNLMGQEFFYQKELGKFSDASSFSYSPSGFFYVADRHTNEIFKIDTLGNVKKYIGGYGWDESYFDDPIFIFSTLLNVYVTDKNNHRIQMFDKDLNYITQLSNQNPEQGNNNLDNIIFGYPLGCVVSTMGDFFVLDSENKRVLKFDPSGNFLLQFGGYDAGRYSLSDPKRIAITNDNKIFVLDDSSLIIFDQFGNGLLKVKLSENFSDINITYDQLVLNNSSVIYYASLGKNAFEFKKAYLSSYDNNEEIIEALITGNNLFVLTKNYILLFKMNPLREKG